MVGLAALLVAVGALAGLIGIAFPSARTPVDSVATRPEPGRSDSDESPTNLAGRPESTRAIEGRRVLRAQARAVLHGERADYLRTVDPKADEFHRIADRTYQNLRRMDVAAYRFGAPVEDAGALTPDRRRQLGASGWVGTVPVTVELAGPDHETWTAELRVLFVERNGRTYVANDREGMSSATALPLWLTGTIDVARGEHSVVIGTESAGDLELYARTADQAVPRVSAIWGDDWRQHVVVVVPGSQRQMERLVGAEPGSQGEVAAVTTSVGRGDPEHASHVVVNPRTFSEVGQLGQLVVLTHETTHVATDATVSGMPLWLSEGFADYVGFSDTNLSVEVIAQELFADVRVHGVPGDLPDADAFDSRAEGLDRSYEAAWLACRYIAEHWSEETLLEFYREMERTDIESQRLPIYEQVLGVTYQDFLAGWRAYVDDADVVE